MASAAQIAANRANAQRSTGPKTEEGKARSSRNNMKYGLTAKEFVVLPGEEQTVKDWITGLQDEVQPCGDLELDLFRQLAHASWTLHRCRQAEVQSFNNQRYKGYDILAYPVSEDAIKFIDLYTRRAERSYQRALKELKILQTERLLRDASHPAPAPLADPRIVTQQKQSAAGEKAMSASAGQTHGSETAAAAQDDLEKSNPIEHSRENAGFNAAPVSQSATPPLRTQAAASGSAAFEKSNPIENSRASAESNVTPESQAATPSLRTQAAASGSGSFEKSKPIPGGSPVTAEARPVQ